MSSRTRIGGAVALFAVLLAAAATAEVAGTPELRITLAPGAPDTAQDVPYVDVTVSASGIDAQPGEALFRLAKVANTVPTSAGDLASLEFVDGQGVLATTVSESSEDDSNSTVLWRATRPVTGTVVARYRVPIDARAPLLSLPQYELRTGAATFSGSANAFVLLPADDAARSVAVHWEFSHYGTGGNGISSLGIGNVRSHEALVPERIASMYFMGGRPGVYRSPDDRFFAAWHGTPPFDMNPLMQWAARLHEYYGSFFRYAPAVFGVFGRSNELNPGSGIGLTDSFAFTFADRSRAGDLRSLLAHEMLHSWVRSLDESMDAPGGLDRAWFGEGLAVHYQRLLPYRAGLMSADDFLADLNETAGRYYTNLMIHVPNEQIAAGFWRDTRIRVLPYDRGSLYFATLDARLRQHSAGQRSLDDLVRAMLDARRTGHPMDEALWRRLLRDELGEPGLRDLDAMLSGQTVLPPSDAFGPEFRRGTRWLRRYELGFDPDSLLTRPRIVRGLKAGSNAAQAGLREGDEILHGFPQDALQGDQQAFLALDVRRGEQALVIRYQPRGEAVEAWQWERAGPSRAMQPAAAHSGN